MCVGKPSAAFDDILFGFDNDVISAFLFCERLAGVTIVIPTKAHKTFFATKMLEAGFTQEKVISMTGISRKTVYRMMGKIAKGGRE